MRLIGVDVGGTFTDVVLYDVDTLDTFIHKVPTTLDDPSIGVLSGIVDLCATKGIDVGSIDYIRHGTTIATNAVLEHGGAETGVVTSEGFRDILHIGRHQRPQHYSIYQEIPWQDQPLVRRYNRLCVPERIAPPYGDVLTPLDEAAVRECALEFKSRGVGSIAVCFLFSYLNPQHEQRAKAFIKEVYPEAFVSVSADVSPQYREFERFTTTAMNAFIGPKVRNYVANLTDRLRDSGFDADLHIMTSSGGVATPQMIEEKPVLTLLSGPAAGVLGGAWAGALSNRDHLTTFDVGGTSADIALIIDGQFQMATARETQIGGYPIMLPMIDIHTIGAGGGSIAHLDAGGAFKVGPKSAGARPGPAAYGHGGTQATVTDANVVLGRLVPAHFLGGTMRLDANAAQRVVGQLAEQLDLSLEETAEGILTLLNANMANAIRSRTVQKGIDPREFSLVAFGGAGPLHGVEVAAQLGIREVIVPSRPGISSAVGLLTTGLRYDTIRTAFQVSDNFDTTRLTDDFDAMAQEIAAQFEADGVSRDDVSFQRAADLRYLGQGYELKIDLPAAPLDDGVLATMIDDFHARHESEYGHAFPGKPIEVVNIRVAGVGRTRTLLQPEPAAGGDVNAALIDRQLCMFRTGQTLHSYDTPIYRRRHLPIGVPIAGPAIIVQTDSTTVVPPNWQFTVEPLGNLVITRSA
ncbi:hydantoinase/oxoprolinase family protein [Acidihalobacter ferrooxydans]|uniref:Methylhydantoinase n=1 Tax=Acidihalobacter ferrooxydans TaxID=1765967 RepID=A0A1P8UIX7_9GAMM|nr:hydantoinase/oxoprolinase family protein [Acidihalobacter ferrooxydans]APZ43773.1 methylhydantoinase [Acidihalobacter ferrooxydans]